MEIAHPGNRVAGRCRTEPLYRRLAIVHLELGERAGRRDFEQNVSGTICIEIASACHLPDGRYRADALPRRLAVVHLILTEQARGRDLQQDVPGPVAVEITRTNDVPDGRGRANFLPARLPVLHLELAEVPGRILKQDVAGTISVEIAGPHDLRTGRRPAYVLPTRLSVLHFELADISGRGILKQDVARVIAIEFVWLRCNDREIESRRCRADVAEAIGLGCGERVIARRQLACFDRPNSARSNCRAANGGSAIAQRDDVPGGAETKDHRRVDVGDVVAFNAAIRG